MMMMVLIVIAARGRVVCLVRLCLSVCLSDIDPATAHRIRRGRGGKPRCVRRRVVSNVIVIVRRQMSKRQMWDVGCEMWDVGLKNKQTSGLYTYVSVCGLAFDRVCLVPSEFIFNPGVRFPLFPYCYNLHGFSWVDG